MPRLFTALEIPRSVAESLARLRGGVPGARWIDVENYHVTCHRRVDAPAGRGECASFIRRPEVTTSTS
jgi:2'-5' RNA ligase